MKIDKRKTERYDAIVGVDTEGTVIILEETFAYSDSFHGAVGCSLEIYNKKDRDAINDVRFKESAGIKELWLINVNEGGLEQGLAEWSKEYRKSIDQDEIIEGQDCSYSNTFQDAFALLSDEAKQSLVDAVNAAKHCGYLSDIFTKFESVQDFEENAMTHCIGGGRMFDYQDSIEWKAVINPELIAIYEAAEKGEQS